MSSDSITDVSVNVPTTRNVLVITSFGGGDQATVRKSILEFMRIKYIIERKIEVYHRHNDPLSRLNYNVTVFKAEIGAIPSNAIDRIAGTDIVVALITEKNVNVVYELAVRNIFRT
jgi:hypothetical protein